MIITSSGTWFKKDTEIKPLYLTDSIMLVVGVIEKDNKLELDEELCGIEELIIDGHTANDMFDEELFKYIDEYEKYKGTEEDMKKYIKNKYGIEDES